MSCCPLVSAARICDAPVPEQAISAPHPGTVGRSSCSGTSWQINFQGVIWSRLQMLKDRSSAAIFCEEIKFEPYHFHVSFFVVLLSIDPEGGGIKQRGFYLFSWDILTLCQDLKIIFGVLFFITNKENILLIKKRHMTGYHIF